eukprot:12642982-Heterocapsa_arctica.AAC.1
MPSAHHGVRGHAMLARSCWHAPPARLVGTPQGHVSATAPTYRRTSCRSSRPPEQSRSGRSTEDAILE